MKKTFKLQTIKTVKRKAISNQIKKIFQIKKIIIQLMMNIKIKRINFEMIQVNKLLMRQQAFSILIHKNREKLRSSSVKKKKFYN